MVRARLVGGWMEERGRTWEVGPVSVITECGMGVRDAGMRLRVGSFVSGKVRERSVFVFGARRGEETVWLRLWWVRSSMG